MLIVYVDDDNLVVVWKDISMGMSLKLIVQADVSNCLG